jgi:hypothetical protein
VRFVVVDLKLIVFKTMVEDSPRNLFEKFQGIVLYETTILAQCQISIFRYKEKSLKRKKWNDSDLISAPWRAVIDEQASYGMR